MSQNKQNTVVIQNPSPGGSRYTSRKNAEHLVRRSIAEWADDGHRAISFISGEWLAMAHASDAARIADDKLIEGRRGGMLWWNGSDHRPDACHRPGENVIYPRPDRAMPYFRALERISE